MYFVRACVCGQHPHEEVNLAGVSALVGKSSPITFAGFAALLLRQHARLLVGSCSALAFFFIFSSSNNERQSVDFASGVVEIAAPLTHSLTHLGERASEREVSSVGSSMRRHHLSPLLLQALLLFFLIGSGSEWGMLFQKRRGAAGRAGVAAQRVMCPCDLTHTYCKYDDHDSKLWPYPGVCFETTVQCDCLNCPDTDKTKFNPCRNHSQPAPSPSPGPQPQPAPAPKATTTTTTAPQPPQPVVYTYAPDCMAFYDQHSNDSSVAFLRWDLAGLLLLNGSSSLGGLLAYAFGLNDAKEVAKDWMVTSPPPSSVSRWNFTSHATGFGNSTAAARPTTGHSSVTSNAPVATTARANVTTATTTSYPYPTPVNAFPMLPVRVVIDILISVVLVGTFLFVSAIELLCTRVRWSCVRSLSYFGMPMGVVSATTGLGLLFTIPSIFLFYLTVPNTAGVSGSLWSSGSDHRNLLERIVVNGLGFAPIAREGANVTTPNIACSLAFRPINAWALLCLLCQWMYILGRPFFVGCCRHSLAQALLHVVDFDGSESVAVVADPDALYGAFGWLTV